MWWLRVLIAAGVIALAMPLAATAQRAREPARVSVLSPQHASEPSREQRDPFEQGLRELGWVPGSNILIEYHYADGQIERLPELAADLVRRKVDIIVVRGPQAAHAARQATSTIPIIMSATPDPVGAGFAASLARPGGNVTGLTFLTGVTLEAKRLELLKEALPGLTRVGFLTNPTAMQDPDSSVAKALQAAAELLGLQVQTFEIRRPSALPEVFAAVDRARVGALLVQGDPHILEPHRVEVVALAADYRLPAMYPWRLYVDAGGLMAYGTSISDFHRRSASYVDKILKGAKPGELPIEQPTKFDLIVNLKTARVLGLDLRSTLLARADEVIE